MVDRLDTRPHGALRLWPIVLLRVYTGVFFAWHGGRKLLRDNFVDGMTGFLNSNLESSASFYRVFAEMIVLPNKEFFASLVAWGELAIGISMILGLATRYAAFFGAVMVLNFWLAKGGSFLSGSNSDVVWLMIFIVLGFIPAGKVAGLDDGLSDRLRFLR